MKMFLSLVVLPLLSRHVWSQDTSASPDRKLVFTSKEASVDAIFQYVSSVTGWVFVFDQPCSGTITAISDTEVSLDRCLDFLNSAIRSHNLVVVNPMAPALPARGQTLRVVSTENARLRPGIFVGGQEEAIPASDQFRMQIIPLKAAAAAEIQKELGETLRALLGEQGQIAVSTYSNSLILTGRSEGVRRAARLLQAIDVDASSESRVSLIPLQYADATETARTLNEFFAKESVAENRSPFPTLANMLRLGRVPGQRIEGEGGNGPTPRGGLREAIRITPDSRMNALLVSANAENIKLVESLVSRLDVKSTGTVEVKIYKLVNAEALAMSAVLESIFRDRPSASTPSRTPSPALIDRLRDGPGLRLAGTPSTGDKEVPSPGQVFEVTPDSRTRSVIVKASHACLEIVDTIIGKLDGDKSDLIGTYVVQLRYADAANVAILLQNLLKDTPPGRPAASSSPFSSMQPIPSTPSPGGTGNVPRMGGSFPGR
ncbi:MAG TPA: secretin N-terminal domain-containing protein [Planctomycetota bacterium]|nr:secretin N-terminal domain-containing protein [Planctomycetota bacterium]